MLSLRTLCVRRVAAYLEELSARPWSVQWLEMLPPDAADELIEQLVALGRWHALPWRVLRLVLIGCAPDHVDLANQTTLVEDADFRAVATGRRAPKFLRASSWISDETVLALLRQTRVERLQLGTCPQLRLALAPSLRPSASEPLSEHLVELDLSCSAVSDTAMRRLLPGLPALRVLRACRTRLSARAFCSAQGGAALVLPRLRTLQLRSCAGFVDDPALLASCFPRLESLDLSGALPAPRGRASPITSSDPTSRGAGALAAALRTWAPTLRELRLSDVGSLDAASFYAAGELPALLHLDLSGSARADEAVRALCAPALTSICVGGGEAARSGERAVLALLAAGACGANSPPALRALELHLCEGGLALLARAARDDLSASGVTEPQRRAGRALTALTLVDCGLLDDGAAAALTHGCPALRALRLRRVRQRNTTLHADGHGARQLLARLREAALDGLGAGGGGGGPLELSLPLAERIDLELTPDAQLDALNVPSCRALALSDAQQPHAGAHRAKSARADRAAHGARATSLYAPLLEQLALSRCDPSLAVALAVGALGTSNSLRALCVHDCALGVTELARLAPPLRAAAARSLRACRFSGALLPVADDAVRELYGAVTDVCELSASRQNAQVPCACARERAALLVEIGSAVVCTDSTD